MKARLSVGVSLVILLLLTACSRAAGQAEVFEAPSDESFFEEEAMLEAMEGDFAFDDVDTAGRSAGAAAPQSVAMDGVEQQAQQIDRLIIRTGTLSIEAEDTRETQEAIEDIVARYGDQGAFVVSSNESGGTGDRNPSISMSIRVPSSEFDQVMDEIADLAVEVNFRNQSGQDVTEEFVDLSARIESLEAARDRLLEIIEEAQTTEDLLLAEQQLTQREAELEALKGRAQFLQDSARLSSISVSIDPYILSQPIDNRWNPSETVRRAIDNFVFGVQGLIDFFILFGIGVLPFLLLFGTIIFVAVRGVVRVVRNNRRKKKQEQQSNAAAPAPTNDDDDDEDES